MYAFAQYIAHKTYCITMSLCLAFYHIRSIYCRKCLLMKVTLSIKNIPSQQGKKLKKKGHENCFEIEFLSTIMEWVSSDFINVEKTSIQIMGYHISFKNFAPFKYYDRFFV